MNYNDNFDCYAEIPIEDIPSTSYNYNYEASTSSDPFDFSQSGKINWNDFYYKMERLRKRLTDKSLIDSMNNLKKELEETIKNPIGGFNHLIILINIFLKENQEMIDYLAISENINLKTFELRKNVQNLFKKMKAEILTDGITKHFIQLKNCFKINNNTFNELIKDLIYKKLNNELDDDEEEEIERTYKYLREYYLTNKAANIIYRLLSKEIMKPKYINDIELYRALFYKKPKRNFCFKILCGSDENENQIKEEAYIYLKIYWITEYFIKTNLINLDEQMKEIIKFIEKNQSLPISWVNAFTYEAKSNIYQLPKIPRWTKNINLTIVKLLVGYTRFEKFYKLNSVFGELMSDKKIKKKFKLIENLQNEINGWSDILPEDFYELIYKEEEDYYYEE